MVIARLVVGFKCWVEILLFLEEDWRGEKGEEDNRKDDFEEEIKGLSCRLGMDV